MIKTERHALYLLGTGTPTPTKLRFGTAYVLQIGRDFLLFDCGPATTYKLVRSDLWPTRAGLAADARRSSMIILYLQPISGLKQVQLQ